MVILQRTGTTIDMNCKCLIELNAKLKDKNLRLASVALVAPSYKARFYISTNWVDSTKIPKGKKKCPPNMMVSFCPFCGLPVEEEKPEPKETSS